VGFLSTSNVLRSVHVLTLEPKKILDETILAPATYRCVCGEMFSLGEADVRCPKCDRRYSAKVIQAATAETAIFNRNSHPEIAGFVAGVAVPEGKTEEHSGEDVTIDSEMIEEDANIGRMLGHYRIVETLGAGGMGKVYRAIDESLQRYVAIKVINASEGSNGKADLEQLFQEARAQARVNHAHVAHIYFVGMESNTPFLAMELVGNATMADVLKQRRLTFHQIVHFAQQIVDALAQSAKYDIVHRDVKPSNILMVDDDTIKLSDFGMAARISKSSGTTVVAGTPDYMAPESTRGVESDHRGDMYSLGVTLFEMTFGRLPYPSVGNDLSLRLEQHRSAPVDFPEAWPVETPIIWRGVLERLMAKNPADRYANFEELTKELNRIEPIARPRAGILLRGVAWTFDWLIINAVIVAILSLFGYFVPQAWEVLSNTRIEQSPVIFVGVSLLSIFLQAVFLGLVALLQATWGTTPGKRLFQIHIADRHGFQPPFAMLALRTIFQYPWAWTMLPVSLCLILFNIDLLAIRTLLVFILLLVEVGFVVFGKGRSLHDRIFGTRVVLDNRPSVK